MTVTVARHNPYASHRPPHEEAGPDDYCPRIKHRRHPVARDALMRFILVLATTAVGGCGHKPGDGGPARPGAYHWRSLYRDDVRTVAVPTFTTRDFTRGVEFQISRAVAQQVESRTPYKVAARERADTVLEGEVVSVRVDRLADDRLSSTPQEQLLVYTVNFTWTDLRTGRTLVRRRNFQQAAPYYPTLGEGRFVGAQHAADELAAAIVRELQADW